MKRRRQKTPEPDVDVNAPRQLRKKPARETPGKVKPRGPRKGPVVARQQGPDEEPPTQTTEGLPSLEGVPSVSGPTPAEPPTNDDQAPAAVKKLITYGRSTTTSIPAFEEPLPSLRSLLDKRTLSSSQRAGTSVASSTTLVVVPPSKTGMVSSVHGHSTVRPRPRPRPVILNRGTLRSPDSDDGFNHRKNRERARAKRLLEPEAPEGDSMDAPLHHDNELEPEASEGDPVEESIHRDNELELTYHDDQGEQNFFDDMAFDEGIADLLDDQRASPNQYGDGNQEDSVEQRSSTPSGSNFSDDRRTKEGQREWRRERGRSFSDTEEEDEEDDRALRSSVIPESPTLTQYELRHRRMLHANPPPMASSPTLHIRNVHARKAISPTAQDKELSEDDSIIDIDDDPGAQDEEGDEDEAGDKRGPGHRISQEEERDVADFGEDVKRKAAVLGRKYGRKTRDILIRAKLGLRLSRKDNLFCQYKVWYAQHNKMPAGMSLAAYGQLILSAYRELMSGLAAEDKEGRRKRMEPILANLNALKMTPGDHLRSDVSMFRADVKQLCNMTSAMTLGRPNTQIVGVVIYLGNDCVAQQLSGIFASSDIAKSLIDKDNIRVQRLIDKVTTKFRAFKDDQEMNDDSDVDDTKETAECRAREKFRAIVQVKILGDIQKNWNTRAKMPKDKLQWKGIINLLHRGGLVLGNWSIELGIPGPSFVVSKVSGDVWRVVAIPIINNSDKQIYVARLDTADLGCRPSDVEYGEIPLITDVDGRVLSRMRDCPAYIKSLPQPPTANAKPSTTIPNEQPIRPIPVRHLSAADSPNPCPRKRLRDGTLLGETPTIDLDGFGLVDDDHELPEHQYLYTMPSDDEALYDDDNIPTYLDPGCNVIEEWDLPEAGDDRNNGPSQVQLLRHKRAPPTSLRDLAQRDMPPPSARGLKPGLSRASGSNQPHVLHPRHGAHTSTLRLPQGQRPPAHARASVPNQHNSRSIDLTPGPSHLPSRAPSREVAYYPNQRKSRPIDPTPGPSRLPSRRPSNEAAYYRQRQSVDWSEGLTRNPGGSHRRK